MSPVGFYWVVMLNFIGFTIDTFQRPKHRVIDFDFQHVLFDSNAKNLGFAFFP